MADLQIRVTEAEYRDQLSRLRSCVNNLTEQLAKLRAERNKLESNFISTLLSGNMREMIVSKENQVQGAIQSVNNQISQIENYLASMGAATTAIGGKIRDAADINVEAFM